MTRAVVGLLALAACGRRDFDVRIDAGAADAAFDGLAAHDEDGDGIPDTMDPCPHVAGDLTDTDGDGVGDACDPNPTMATEKWALFATMQTGNTALDDLTGFDQEADSLHVAGSVQPVLSMPLGVARVDLGWTIHAVLGTGVQHQIAFGIDTAAGGPEYYFTELNDNMSGVHDAAIFQYDMTNGYAALDSQDPGLLHAGDGFTRMDAGTTHRVLTGWTDQMYQLMAATPAYAGGVKIRFALNNLDVSLRYLAIIVTN